LDIFPDFGGSLDHTDVSRHTAVVGYPEFRLTETTVERTTFFWDIFFILLAIAIIVEFENGQLDCRAHSSHLGHFFILLAIANLVEFELVNWVIFNSNFLKDSRPGISRSTGTQNTGIDQLLLISEIPN